MGRRGGGFGGGRMGGGGRSGGFGGGGRLGGGGRSGGSLGGFGGGRPAGRGSGIGGGLGGSRPAPRRPAPRRGGFGTGMAVGMGMGMGMRRRRMWGWGGGWGWGRPRTVVMGGGGHHGGAGGCGCMAVIGLALLVVFIALIAYSGGHISQRQPITRSTIERTALPRGSAGNIGEMFIDHTGTVQNRTQMLNGLNNFHNETGVRPVVYLLGVNEFPGAAGVARNQIPAHVNREMPEFARATFDRLGLDEAHLLLVFFEFDDGMDYFWSAYPLAGNMARAVVDMEAMDILLDYVGRFYYQYPQSRDSAFIFGNAFDRTGSRIMATQVNIVLILILVVGGIIVLLILFTWWKRKQEQKNIEAEQTERILGQQLNTFGTETNDAASRLAQEYEDNDNNEN